MQNKKIISVIVPIYNSERYLNDTLKSLENQTIFDKLEIILIDDGSEDNSVNIIMDFSKKHEDVKVILGTNEGVSAARNKGLKNSTCEYIAFLDSDDTVSNELYEKLYDLIITSQSEIAIIDFQRIFPNGSTKKYRPIIQKNIYNNTDILISFLSGNIIGNNLFDKLFKTDIIGSCVFPTEYKIGEDMYFLYQVLKRTNKISIDTRYAYYNYYVRESSAMNSSDDNKFTDNVKLSEEIAYDLISNPVLSPYAEAHLVHEKCKSIEYILRNNQQSNSIYVKQYQSDIKKYSIIKLYRYLTKKQFLGFVLIRISPTIYLIIHKILKIG